MSIGGAREILKELGKYENGKDPHSQMDEEVVRRCRELSLKEDLNYNDVQKLLDDCAYGSLCTDFVMVALMAVKDILKDDLQI